MKQILCLLTILIFGSAAYGQRIPKEEKKIIHETGFYKYFNIPTIDKNGQPIIQYQAEVKTGSLSPEKKYKRMQQFIAKQNWTNIEHIKCKDETLVSTSLVEKDITFKDEEDGIIMGNGFSKFSLGEREHMYVTFQYELRSTKDGYIYTLNDFEVLEFVHGSTSKGRASGVALGGFATGGTRTKFNDDDVRVYKMERYLTHMIFEDAYHLKSGKKPIEKLGLIISTINSDLKSVMIPQSDINNIGKR